ncbi:enoyl-CoA hydratase/isomerase family protein [Conexibacter stalactiti]|uniref:Enoyl-CoA hydratase/isomerase family protein n=1 Tax=Conexibacter stalactiti TaxID=1940611 RepID=A0ABU4HKB9_9ACTN|nr:enoyl-CoA hydratase/isomerase family protein [Conexibacter stalactiti]MDW5593766.1 enoyl-CoA hydratase/isomerase family protein [Conexibacter stalactiti]MEC5034408.1 enoyl-CoA hydratase/isomerase family protein [Conexibacter stalactiti]
MTSIDGLYRTHLEQYAPTFEQFFKLRLENGILEVRMHTDGGPLRWGGGPHRMLIPLFQTIDHDDDVEVVILTGTGDTFNAELNTEDYVGQGMLGHWNTEKTGYDLTYRDQTREPMALLGLHVPVICAINGPVWAHAELALLNDIVICSETTSFYDGHWELLGLVPGDGVQTVFRELLGHNRGRYFLYSGQRIEAAEALSLGLVGEVLPAERLLDRAWEIAESVFMSKSRVQRRLARATLIQPWRELFVKEIAFGMAHECLGAAIGPPVPLSGPLAEAFS